MRLFLVRHGKAKSKREDPERPLTESGAEAIRRTAVWAVQAGVKVDRIWHSGKTRAVQTAAILADHLAPPQGVSTVSGLGPMDEVRPVAEELCRRRETLMVVGHLPFLGRLAAQLVTGNPDTPLLEFRSGGIVCLSVREGAWSVRWAVSPDLVAPGAGHRRGRP